MKNSRIEEEKKVVEQMIRLYCQKKEGNGELCQNCHELLDYAHSRLDRCRYGRKSRHARNVLSIATVRI